MKAAREHPVLVTAIAFALAAAVVVVIAGAAGFDAFGGAWSHLHPGWLALAIVPALLAIPAYVLAYRAVARTHGGPPLPVPLAVRVVTAGFGPFAVGGGFAIDKRALHALSDDSRAATVRVLGLGALEWAVLAPLAWLAAVVLLIGGGSPAMPSLLWPWAIAVPIGFCLGLWAAAPARRERIGAGGRVRRTLVLALRGVAILRTLAGSISSCWPAWAGVGLYWALDIASLYGAVRFIGLRPDLGETILAYATGYALTRRSTPLGGAGATEALMTFALHWVGQPVAPALAAVVVYRLFNFALPTLPALRVRRRIKPLLDAGDRENGSPAPRVRRRAAAPLGSR